MMRTKTKGVVLRCLPRVTTAVAALLVQAAACAPGRITDTPSGSTPSDTSTRHDTTVVQRATLNVHVAIDDSSDAAIAATAGVTAAGLTVHLTRDAATAAPQTAVTDAAGNVQFTHLIPASYQLSVERPLTTTELARLTPADREASIFAAGTSIYVSPPTSVSYISLVAARRGSLIISELYVVTATINGCGGCGGMGHYVEFYNNGDTTAYLDGMLMFRTGSVLHISWTGSDPNYPAFSCDVLAAQRLDDTGLWAYFIERFPGTGRDYPVRPGEARVWAMDAVDHSPLGGGMQNLTGATFESIGSSADPDNPSAANMILMTSTEWGTHGLPLASAQIIGLAAPIVQDTSQLERIMLPRSVGWQYDSYFKMPRAAVLDAVGVRPTPERAVFGANQSGWRECTDPWSSPVFERSAAQLVDFTVPLAISRRSLGFTPTGAEILQRTRTSARDFVLANPLLRSLRK